MILYYFIEKKTLKIDNFECRKISMADLIINEIKHWKLKFFLCLETLLKSGDNSFERNYHRQSNEMINKECTLKLTILLCGNPNCTI